MKVIIITDSLGLPRSTPESVQFEDTYIEKLKDRYKDIKFISLSLGGATLATLKEQYFNYFQPVNPDLVIVHAGIVDCAPRALKKWEAAVINSNFVSRKIYSVLFKRHTTFIRKVRKLTYTPMAQFEKMVGEFGHLLQDKVVWFTIIPARTVYEEQLPGIADNINNYNSALKSVLGSRVIDLADMPDEGIMSDHHHINEIGHRHVYLKLTGIIDELRNKAG
ncbi:MULTISPECIES: hypothetical protein [unclassified Chitinophaga]|uniref:hypothetical protein n=1 Tax=unclassified Chitinophaga TaxID=2619133 RepID=UPI0030101696